MSPKYKLTKTADNWAGRACYRIEALKDFADIKTGDLGGFVQSTANLSQDGDCWIHYDAVVLGEAFVGGNAKIDGEAVVEDSAIVTDNAYIGGECWITDTAKVSGDAQVYDDTWVSENSEVKGDAIIKGDTSLWRYTVLETGTHVDETYFG